MELAVEVYRGAEAESARIGQRLEDLGFWSMTEDEQDDFIRNNREITDLMNRSENCRVVLGQSTPEKSAWKCFKDMGLWNCVIDAKTGKKVEFTWEDNVKKAVEAVKGYMVEAEIEEMTSSHRLPKRAS